MKEKQEKTILMKVNIISKNFKDQMRKESEKAGFPHAYRPILFHLKNSDGLTQAELAEKTLLKAPTISLTLQKMEYAGLIKRDSDKEDLRITRVFITKEGLEACEKLHQLAENFEKKIINHLSSEDLDKAQDVIGKLLDAIIEEVDNNENI